MVENEWMIPRVQTLAGLTLRCLKEGIIGRRWVGELPGERRLADELQVSRPVLRTALRRLEEEGWIRVSPRKATRIVRKIRRTPTGRPLVCVISRGRHKTGLFENLYRVAGEHNMRVRELVVGCHDFSAEIKKLDGVDCWILLGSEKELQSYFMRRKLPCLIVGHRYDGIRLPSIDMDNRATCRHAAGTLLGRGCRKLVLLLSKSHRAGDLASITGFREAVKAHPGAEGQILETTDDATIICKRLDGLWLKEEPLGFVVLNPYIFITLYLHAGRLGRDFAAVSVYDDECLRYIPQAVARYSNVSLFQQASALVARQVFQPPLPCRETLLIPQFIDGRSAYLHDR